VAEPSTADELITRRLKDALALVDIRVLDHFIVGDGICMSSQKGGLSDMWSDLAAAALQQDFLRI